jgi:hypothetical protein
MAYWNVSASMHQDGIHRLGLCVVIGTLLGGISPLAAGPEADLAEAATRVGGHPRLFMKPGEPARLRERIKEDARSAMIAEAVMAKADALLEMPPLARRMEGRRMLSVSRMALDRLATLSMAWHLGGERSHVDRAIIELRAVAAFEDWNPAHFLDTAEMTMGVALAYDWLHAELDPATREIARRAIFDKGLTPALASERHWWMTTTNNWNQVCHGGLVAGALVLLDHEREASLRILERALRHLPNAMASYAPLGAYPEGPGYWSYGTSYNVILLAMLESALGSTFGLEKMEGFDLTGSFPILMTGPSGQMFNFSDGRANRGIQPAIYWLARRFSQPGWASHEDRMFEGSTPHALNHWLLAVSLLWRDAPAGPAALKLPLHWTSRGEVPVSVHRDSWERADAVFVGIKGGSPSASHGHMDIGSFVLDADGVRWAHELGMENYHHVESRGMSLWSKAQNGERWKVFRNSNLSHNTLVIDGQLQRADADAPMARFSDDPAFPHSVVDLSPSYRGQLKQAHRGIALLPGGAVLVRDHLTGLHPGAEVRWGMFTRATVGETGNPTLTLRESGKELVLTIHGDTAPRWQTVDLATLTNEWDSPTTGYALVSFTAIAPESGTLDLTVVMRPGSRAATELAPAHLAHPLEWSGGGR